jgi:hypothetical protein
MPAFEVSLVIRARPDDLFALTQDYALRLQWDPFLREARLLDGATAAATGVRSWCVAWYGVGMETEYVSFNPPRVAAVRMTRGPGIVRAFAGSWRFEDVGAGRTRVGFRYRLTARPRQLAFLLDPLLRIVFARDTGARLRALRSAVERTNILDHASSPAGKRPASS